MAVCRASCLSHLTMTCSAELSLNRILGTWDGFGQGLTSGNEARLCVLNKLEGMFLG